MKGIADMRLKAQIMDEAALGRALMRISHEIAEKNKGVENVQLIGVRRRGEPIAAASAIISAGSRTSKFPAAASTSAGTAMI